MIVREMDQQEVNILKILEALNENDTQSQRELSKKLNISLGLVNSLLKKIIKRGYYNVITTNNSKLKYILTPKGIFEKSILSYRHILLLIESYCDACDKVKLIFDELAKENKKRIILFGAGELAEIAYIVSKKSTLRLVGVVDEKLYGTSLLDTKIWDISYLQKYPFDAVVITDMNDPAMAKKNLIEQGIAVNKIVSFN